MNIKRIIHQGYPIALVASDSPFITDTQSALDFMMQVHYDIGTRSIIINKEAVIEGFFVLSTKIAGDILQKVINYGFRLAIVGDYSCYTSKPLQDFIYESNKGRSIFFVSSEEDALAKLIRP